MTDFDLIVIGVGMAGMNAAKKCAKAGWSVAVVDELPYGGTCALRGCDPKKMLRRGAEIVEAARLMNGRGINSSNQIAWADLMAHKRSFTDPVPEKMEGGLSDAGVSTLHGSARFNGPNELTVGDRRLTARRFLIATGQTSRRLEVPGRELSIDSTDFLELETLPRRILFVGGGYVSMEFAHIAARAGAEVIVADRGERPLKGFDPDLVDRLVEASQQVGISFEFRAELTGIERDGAAFAATLSRGGETFLIKTALVVNGAGRKPMIEHLDLEAAGVAFSERGISVTEYLRSISNDSIYAAGDCAATEGPPLTPVAVHEGVVAASNILKGDHRTPDYKGAPSVAFTIPEIVRIGMTEDEAHETSGSVSIRSSDTGSWFSNRRIGSSEGYTKIIIDDHTDELLGVHLFGQGYAETANIFALAMQNRIRASDLRRLISAYPTIGSDVSSMLS